MDSFGTTEQWFSCTKGWNKWRGWNPRLFPPWASNYLIARESVGTRGRGRMKIIELGEQHFPIWPVALLQVLNSCGQGIKAQCLRSQGQCKPVRTEASALCVSYLICICLGCTLGLWSTCYSWLLAPGLVPEQRGDWHNTEETWSPSSYLSGRSFLKPFRPNNASCLKSEAAPRGVPGSSWEAEWESRVTGQKGRILFGNKEKALNLQISPTEAKLTGKQPQLGPTEACE